MRNLIKILRNISFPLILLGALFKIMHWPFAGIFLISSLASMFLYFTLKYLFKNKLHWQDHVYFLLSTIVLVFIITRILRWPDMTIVIGCTLSIFLFLYAVFIKKNEKRVFNREEEEQEFDSSIGLLPLTLVALGVAFVILQVPGWKILFFSGLFAQVVHLVLIKTRSDKTKEWDEILDSNPDIMNSEEDESEGVK